MKMKDILVRFLVFLTLLSLGAFAMVACWLPERWTMILDLLEDTRFGVMSMGAVLILLALLFFLTGLRTRPREKFLSYDTEGGTVSIGVDAIADYVTKLGAEFPSVSRMRARVLPARGTLNVVVEVKIKAGPQIHEVCELLQRRVRESLTDGLGISEIGRVEVSVGEIVSEHRPV